MYFHYGSLKTISKNHIYHIRYLGLLYAILTLSLSLSLQSLSNHSPTICCIVNYIEQVQSLTICLFLCCCCFTKSSSTCAWLSYTLMLHLCRCIKSWYSFSFNIFEANDIGDFSCSNTTNYYSSMCACAYLWVCVCVYHFFTIHTNVCNIHL